MASRRIVWNVARKPWRSAAYTHLLHYTDVVEEFHRNSSFLNPNGGDKRFAPRIERRHNDKVLTRRGPPSGLTEQVYDRQYLDDADHLNVLLKLNVARNDFPPLPVLDDYDKWSLLGEPNLAVGWAKHKAVCKICGKHWARTMAV